MKHLIQTRNEQKAVELTPAARALVKRAITAALAYEGFQHVAEVSVTFTDDSRIRELNRTFRGKDAATDVLSFPTLDGEDEFDTDIDAGATVLGDIVISVEHAVAQAREYGHSTERELAFLSVHSTLHLLGYDHEAGAAEESEMFRRQEEILTSMGLPRKTETDAIKERTEQK